MSKKTVVQYGVWDSDAGFQLFDSVEQIKQDLSDGYISINNETSCEIFELTQIGEIKDEGPKLVLKRGYK